MKEIADSINQMFKPFHDLQKIVEPMKRVQESMQPVIRMQKALENITKAYMVSIPNFELPFKDYASSFERISQRLIEYQESTPKHLLLIAEYGWYIDFDSDLNFPHQIAQELEDGNMQAADLILEKYYSSKLERIDKELSERHEDRKEIINEIFEGHKSGKYYLTIPAILSQVDGVCFDFTRKKFFIKERGNNYLPEVTSELESLSKGIIDLFLSPIRNQTPIVVREMDLPKYQCTLNRHKVLHGVSKDYGTKVNSLKCISLLKYISDLLIETDRKNTKHNNM